MKTVIVRSCLETLTPRVFRNAQALTSGGCNVTVLAWDREAKNPKLEYKEGYQAYRFKFKAPYGAKVLLFLPIWWCFEFFWLLRNRWDVVHPMDFDTVIPAAIAAKIKRKSMIYELADIYEDMRPLPRWLRSLGIFIDKLFMRLANGMIIADEAQIRVLDGIPNENIIVIYNSPPNLFKKLGTFSQRDSTFTIFYAGALYKSRYLNLDKVYTAIRSIAEVKLIVAGHGDLIEEIKRWADEIPGKVQFIGRIGYAEALKKAITADLLFALHEPITLNAKYGAGNKLFEAMMCGKPILVNKGTTRADIVERENCGLVVDCHNIEEIKKAIIKLKEDRGLCKELGTNGRKAYEQRYNWKIMEQRLLTLYQEIK